MRISHPFSKTLSSLALMSLLVCGFFVSGSLSCNAPVETGELIGGFCSIERTATPTLWSWSDAHLAVASKKFLLPLLTLLTFLTLLPLPTKYDPAFIYYTRMIEPMLAQHRPVVFIPQLSSPHGW